MNYRKDKSDLIDLKIVNAYKKMVDAENEYNETVKKNMPECIFKEGENVFYTRSHGGKKYCGRIRSISYDPYRWASHHGWYIIVMPLNKDFKKPDKIKSSLHPKDIIEIIKI